MSNKTAMMQLRDELKQLESQSIMYPDSLDLVYELIEKKYLEIEKEQIKDAWEDYDALNKEQYYKETYGK